MKKNKRFGLQIAYFQKLYTRHQRLQKQTSSVPLKSSFFMASFGSQICYLFHWTTLQRLKVLPVPIRNLPFKKFYTVLKEWLLINPLYSPAEYLETEHKSFLSLVKCQLVNATQHTLPHPFTKPKVCFRSITLILNHI